VVDAGLLSEQTQDLRSEGESGRRSEGC